MKSCGRTKIVARSTRRRRGRDSFVRARYARMPNEDPTQICGVSEPASSDDATYDRMATWR
jgi:hypothetical protein